MGVCMQRKIGVQTDYLPCSSAQCECGRQVKASLDLLTVSCHYYLFFVTL